MNANSNTPERTSAPMISGAEILSRDINHQLAYVPQLIGKVPKTLRIAHFEPPFYSQSASGLPNDNAACTAASLLNAIYASGVDEIAKHALRPEDLGSRVGLLWKEFCRAYNRLENTPLAQTDLELQQQGIFHETDLLLQFLKEKSGNWYDWRRAVSPLEVAYTLLKGGAVIAAGMRDHAVTWVDLGENAPYRLSEIDPMPSEPRLSVVEQGFEEKFAASIYWPIDPAAQKRRPLWNAYLVDAWKSDAANYPWNKFHIWIAEQFFIQQAPYQIPPTPPPLVISMPPR